MDGIWTGSAQLVEGMLELDFKVPNQLKKQGMGTAMFEDALNHFGDQVQGIKGQWLSGDNLDSFNKAISSGKTAQEAAFSTATGKWAKENDFTNIEFSPNSFWNEDGTAQSVNLIFSR